MINYDSLLLRYVYCPPGLAKFLEDSHREQCKKEYVPYSVFAGQVLESLKDKALK